MRFRRSQRQTSIDTLFEHEFAQEIMKSDRLRVTILIAVVIGTLPVTLALSVLWYEQFQQAFHGNYRRFMFTFLGVISSAVVCLVLERIAISRIIEHDGTPFSGLQYLSALVETSLPSVGMLMAAQFLDPVYALFTPAPYIYPVLIVLSTLRLNFRLCVFTGLVAGIEYAVLTVYFLSQSQGAAVEPILTGMPHHLFKGFLLFLTGIVAGLITRQIKRRIVTSFTTIEERNRISRTFGEHVSPVVMDTLMNLKPDLRSEKRFVCVMFLDIRNFTTFAEKREPEQVVDYLESLFGFMIEIVNRHDGVVNKFLGDGFMAVFGAPLSNGADCANALAAALEILHRVEEEVALGNVLPTTVGIGLHAGDAVTGSIGSSLRREYTVIGDVVNLAARIEKLNKQFHSQLLISETVREVTFGAGPVKALPMGEVTVRGRENPIQIYQVA